MSAKIVTVFGGSGFVGRHVVRELAKRGYRVRAAVRRPSLAGFVRTMGLPGQVEAVYADIKDDESVARALSGADMAVNLVGILYESGKQKFDALQAEAAGRIAWSAKAKGVERLVHVSAIGADPDSPAKYASSKAEGEAAVLDAFPDAVILRPSIIFGNGDGFFNRFAAMAKFSPALPLLGGGHTKMQPVYVDDVADAVCTALEDTSTQGKTYELGGPTVYSFKELMQIVLDETQRKRILAPIPWSIARLQGRILGLLPAPLLTLDQVRMLETDNVVSEEATSQNRTIEDLGITPKSVEAIVPGYLWMYRRQGQYAEDIKRETV
ncbi:complex I NDUFA9 subunit family protein [Candidatus Phaeomarinobacter ectocarpi]|uniref:complex I NDUFA9 subunit family protein n=1 Tax=Candidatus Phaeomarinibacter ectocarpi TaxID=1458461 RepID=UPI0005C4B5B3|nr:complex I NDUFA9 subunit family protein [Candidatus Phaeomarinobacter ectocarpi]